MSDDGCTSPNGHQFSYREEFERHNGYTEFFPMQWCPRCNTKQPVGSSYRVKDEDDD